MAAGRSAPRPVPAGLVRVDFAVGARDNASSNSTAGQAIAPAANPLAAGVSYRVWVIHVNYWQPRRLAAGARFDC
jgi:hypothetical protein